MSLANRVLPYAAPGLRPPQPVRDDGDPPRLVRSESIDDALVDTVLTELEAVDEGNVAVIVPDSMVDEVRSVFEARALSIGGANRHGLDQRITLVPVRLVKGLEVDSAVVVEPARIIDEESQGIRSLYVALTRATKRVAVVHSRELPAMLQE
jgi:DNA helicase IV